MIQNACEKYGSSFNFSVVASSHCCKKCQYFVFVQVCHRLFKNVRMSYPLQGPLAPAYPLQGPLAPAYPLYLSPLLHLLFFQVEFSFRISTNTQYNSAMGLDDVSVKPQRCWSSPCSSNPCNGKGSVCAETGSSSFKCICPPGRLGTFCNSYGKLQSEVICFRSLNLQLCSNYYALNLEMLLSDKPRPIFKLIYMYIFKDNSTISFDEIFVKFGVMSTVAPFTATQWSFFPNCLIFFYKDCSKFNY